MPMSDLRVFHLLQRAHGALFRAADRALQAREGVSASQHGVLLLLAQEDGQPISAIAEALKMGKSSLTALIDRMAAARLVRRETDAGDARVQRIFIERGGKAIVARSLGEVKRINAGLLKPFNGAERKTIERFLDHIAANAPSIVEGADARKADGRKRAV